MGYLATQRPYNVAFFAILMRVIYALIFTLLPGALFAQPSGVPNPPPIAAKAFVLTDFNSAQMLVSQNPNQRIEPASLTKLMTAYLTFSALKQKTLKPDQVVPVSTRAWKSEGSRMFIEPTKPVVVEDLIKGMIVQSGNDACVALAEAIAGTEEVFAQMMNREAQRLGMKNTNFMNSTGLPHPQHYTTAYDLSLLANAIIRDFPEYYPYYSLKEYRYNNITQSNRNRLLWVDPTVDGMKTGYTDNAGYCLITSARRGPRRLVSVVLGTNSESLRATESQKLVNYGFQFYDTVRLYEKGQAVSTVRVWKGSANTVKAGFPRDLFLSVPKGVSDKLKASVETQQPLLAPIAAGQQVGVLRVELDGKPYGEFPVVALEEAPLAGIFGRGWDSLRLLFK
ncbi:MAG: beta-lactamase [Betaproteobacteria bacterium]|jgi:D-alanyl-D-alanine carboxypeptidase (penicillin-binding protein 5/6)|nr:beta-lactamase [Betaproteobacteria bacterium]